MTPAETLVLVLLLVAALGMALLLRRAVRRTRVDREPFEIEGKARRDYLKQARRDGLDPDVAEAFEIELRQRRREKERQRKEEERRRIGGIDADIL